MQPLDHLFSEAIQNKISSFLCYPCCTQWSHVSSSIYKSTLHLSARHLILFFSAANITLFDITPLLKTNKSKIPTTNDILDINKFDTIIFQNCYINSHHILDEIILSPLNESFIFKNRLRFCSLIRTLYRCKKAESLTLLFDHNQPSTYSLMPIWDKYLKIIANHILFSSHAKNKITQYHLWKLKTLKLKFAHSWLTNNICSILDCLNNNKLIKWKLIKNLEITSLNFHSLSLLQCDFKRILSFWCKSINVSMICTYLEPKGNEWDDQFINQLLQSYKLLPSSLKILQLFTTFSRVPTLEAICSNQKLNISLIPYSTIYKTLRFDLYNDIFIELNSQKNSRLSIEEMLKIYLAVSDNLSLTICKIISYRNGRNEALIQYILTYIIKYCHVILISKNKNKTMEHKNHNLYENGILRLSFLLFYFLKTFYIEVIGTRYEWIANIAHKLYEISLQLKCSHNISKLISRCSISIDKYVRYCTNRFVFNESRNINVLTGEHNKLFIPLSLPLVSYIDEEKEFEITPLLYANSLSFLYATLLSQILYTPSYHAHSRTMVNLFKMINYNQLRLNPNRYLIYKILLLCLHKNRNLWASQEIANILKSKKKNPNINCMGYPTFIQRNEFDDKLDRIQQEIKESCTKILKYNVTIPLAKNPIYFTNLLNVQNDKRLMEFIAILKTKLVTKHYKINEHACKFFSFT